MVDSFDGEKRKGLNAKGPARTLGLLYFLISFAGAIASCQSRVLVHADFVGRSHGEPHSPPPSRFWVGSGARYRGPIIQQTRTRIYLVFNQLQPYYCLDLSHVFAPIGGTSALCVNTRWNFRLMGYLNFSV